MAAYTLFRLFLICTILAYIITDWSSNLCPSLACLLLVAGSALTVSIVADFLHSLQIPMSGCRSRSVLITGCDHGFGYFIAKKLHEIGFEVFAACLDDKCQGAVDLHETGYKDGSLTVIKLDVTSDADVSNAVATVTERLKDKGLWGLINNAGVGVFTFTELCPLSEYERIINVNTLGMVHVSKAFLPLVVKAKGRVVNLTSIAGSFGLPGYSAYTVSKFASVGFTEVLRREMVAFGVKVINIMPHLYRTAIVNIDKHMADHDRFWSQIPAEVRGRYGQDFADALASKIKSHLETHTRPEIHEVVDIVTDAVTSRYPKPQYTTPRLEEWLMFNVLALLPVTVQDFVLSFAFESVLRHLKR